MASVIFDSVSFGYPESDSTVFENLSLELPAGIVSLLGQNGTGKSTFLLLAGGSIVPDEGTVMIDGMDTRELREESERQRYTSFIFQNMEFETEKTIGDLLPYVYENGFHAKKAKGFTDELVKVFELESCLTKRTQEVSKGELQRTILAFSLLYGSRILLMDEPIFALEPYQKEMVMDFLVNYARSNGLSIYYSVHELDLSEKYSDYLMVFYKDHPAGETPRIGVTKELFQHDLIEQAYEAPFVMLKNREALFREHMKQIRGMR